MRSSARSLKLTVRQLPIYWTSREEKLLRLVDAHTAVQEKIALDGFISGLRLTWRIALELSADGRYFYEQEQTNRLKN